MCGDTQMKMRQAILAPTSPIHVVICQKVQFLARLCNDIFKQEKYQIFVSGKVCKEMHVP